MKKILSVSILFILLYFVFFIHLGKQPIRLWDESRLAFNAYEMTINGNFIITHFEGKPDMWNVKPPFMIWCQALMIKLLGPTEVAIRLPAAIFGLLTALLLVYYCMRYYGKLRLGIFAALVLATTRGYIDEHCARHGEYDSTYIFFITLYTLSFLQYFEQKKIRYLYAGMAGLTLAVLTKGIAGAFALPIVGITAFMYSSVIPALKSRHFYFSLAGVIIFVGGYYLLREHYNPGYIRAVISNEISGRYLEPIEGHLEPRWFYFNRITGFFLKYWVLFIPAGFIAAYFSSDTKVKRLIFYSSFFAVFHFILVTSAESKLNQYVYPVFPFLALIIAFFIEFLYNLMRRLEIKKQMRYPVFTVIFIVALFFTPYKKMIERTYQSPEYTWDNPCYSIGYYLKDVLKGKKEIREPLKVVFTGYKPHLNFYVNLLKERNIPVTSIDPEQVLIGDLVICSKNDDFEFLKAHFKMDKIVEDWDLHILRVTGGL